MGWPLLEGSPLLLRRSSRRSSRPVLRASRHGVLQLIAATGLAATTALLLGMSCGGVDGVRITEPGVGAQLTEGSVRIVAEVKESIDPTTVSLEVNGVDLIAALGLTHPFLDEAGRVVIGSDEIAVSSFDFEPPASGTTRLFVDLAGLAPGDHDVVIRGLRFADREVRTGLRTLHVRPALGLAANR